MRKYSVREIDDMRNSIAILKSYTFLCGNTEDLLRTYMLNGTEVEELRAAADEAVEKVEGATDGRS